MREASHGTTTHGGRLEEDEPRCPPSLDLRLSIELERRYIRKCKLVSHALSYGYIIPMG